MTFRDTEKKRYIRIKENDELFSPEARISGSCMNKHGVFVNPKYCLNDKYSEENIFKGFREKAIDYFSKRGIEWHKPKKTKLPIDKPDNHMCCSQSFCVNTLFYFIDKKEELNVLLNKLGFDSIEILPFYLDKPYDERNPHYLCFEWIGNDNYLNEKIRKGSKRKRGKYFTSADFAIRYKDFNGKISIILGEWKYTEDNKKNDLRYSMHNTDRYLDIYNYSLEIFKGLINCYDDIDYTDLFYEPFDQLMRLTLLAKHIESEHEMDIQDSSVFLIVPKANKEYSNLFFSPKLVKKSKTVQEIWVDLVGRKKFNYIHTEDLISKINEVIPPSDWAKYLNMRYKWSQ